MQTDADLKLTLSQLVVSPRNARKTTATALNELAASIAAHGLLQNLVVVAEVDAGGTETGRYEVVAGGRRLRALQLLASDGRWPADAPISCIRRQGLDAEEASIAENSAREPMHPADEFEAFQGLVNAGRTIEEIAARFGVTPLVVQRRLKLAKVSSKMIERYRAGEASLDQLMALTITDDHKAQERAWQDAAGPWERNPDALRRKLVKSEVEVRSSNLAKFVGIDAYEAAGGRAVRDLFSDAGNAYLADGKLLEQLAHAKLEVAAAEVQAEGWSWVKVDPDFREYQLYRFERLASEDGPLPAADQTRIAALEAERSEAQKQLDRLEESDDYGDDHDRLSERISDLEEEIDAIRESTKHWGDDAKQKAGAIISVSDGGVLSVYRGLIDPRRQDGTAGPAGTTPFPAAKEKKRPALSENLARRLTAHKTAALQVHLIEQPHIALAVLVHSLVMRLFRKGYFGGAWNGSAENKRDPLPSIADDMKDSVAWKKLDALHAEILASLPKKDGDVLPHLLALPQQDLLQLLALCTATSTSAVQTADLKHEADQVADAVGLDMAQWWSATGPSYLNHVPKPAIAEAVKEATSAKDAAPLATMKKGAAVAAAEAKLAGTGWLPKILRSKTKPAARKPAKAKPAAKGAITVQFRDDSGNTWTGRGKRPAWVEAALKAGKTLDELKAA